MRYSSALLNGIPFLVQGLLCGGYKVSYNLLKSFRLPSFHETHQCLGILWSRWVRTSMFNMGLVLLWDERIRRVVGEFELIIGA